MAKNIWFTSDTHFFDHRIKLLCRPFCDEKEMNDTIIENWNSCIKDDDIIYHIGDVVYGEEKDKKIDIVKNLKGKKHLIIGNHDDLKYIDKYTKYFDTINKAIKITYKDNTFYINHYPIMGKKEYFNLVGHIHGSWRVQRNMINVGVDVWHFRPINFDIIISTMDAIRNYYDDDVWVAENEINVFHKNNCNKKGSYSDTLKH